MFYVLLDLPNLTYTLPIINVSQVIEVVLDLGRPPLARFPHGEVQLSSKQVTAAELSEAVAQV